METCITHVAGDDFCIFYAAEVWSRNLAKQMYEEHPDEVKDFIEYEDGGISCKIPFKCMKYIRWPRTRTMSEEEKILKAEALRRGRERKKRG